MILKITLKLHRIPLVSVLIPTYNSESTIVACIGSIKAQTYTNIEIIVIDNYSSDKTRHSRESQLKDFHYRT